MEGSSSTVLISKFDAAPTQECTTKARGEERAVSFSFSSGHHREGKLLCCRTAYALREQPSACQDDRGAQVKPRKLSITFPFTAQYLARFYGHTEVGEEPKKLSHLFRAFLPLFLHPRLTFRIRVVLERGKGTAKPGLASPPLLCYHLLKTVHAQSLLLFNRCHFTLASSYRLFLYNSLLTEVLDCTSLFCCLFQPNYKFRGASGHKS